jgi:hypothetical protein
LNTPGEASVQWRLESDGMIPEAGDVERLTTLLERPLRSYREFATGIAASA